MTLTQHYPPYLCFDPPLFQFTAATTTSSCFNKVSQGSSPWTIYSDDGGPVDSITPHEASPSGFWLLLWFTSVSLMDVHTVRSPKRNRKAVKRPPSSSHSSTLGHDCDWHRATLVQYIVSLWRWTDSEIGFDIIGAYVQATTSLLTSKISCIGLSLSPTTGRNPFLLDLWRKRIFRCLGSHSR